MDPNSGTPAPALSRRLLDGARASPAAAVAVAAWADPAPFLCGRVCPNMHFDVKMALLINPKL